MSNRQWKRIRRELRSIEHDLDRNKRAGMRIPLWIKIAGLFRKKIKTEWIKKWEREHRRKLKKAMKATSHMAKNLS